jgi:hypothetical protein
MVNKPLTEVEEKDAKRRKRKFIPAGSMGTSGTGRVVPCSI